MIGCEDHPQKSEMIYTASGGALNSARSNPILLCCIYYLRYYIEAGNAIEDAIHVGRVLVGEDSDRSVRRGGDRGTERVIKLLSILFLTTLQKILRLHCFKLDRNEI